MERKPARTLILPLAEKKTCPFCSQDTLHIDYKQIKTLGRYLSPFMKIEPRRRSGLCARHQRAVAKALKRARHLALLPFVLR